MSYRDRRWPFSGSSFGRAEQCAAFGALLWVETRTREARDGVHVHEFPMMISAGYPREHALALVDVSVRDWCAKIAVDEIPKGLPEVSLAYDPVTGLGRLTGDRNRRYTVEPGEIPMTLDLICADVEPAPDADPATWLDGATFASIVDWKSTRFAHDPYYDRPQLEIGALTVAAVTGLDTIGIAVGVIDDEGGVSFTRGEVGPAQLMDIANRVRRASDNVLRERAIREREEAAGRVYDPDVTRGHFCQWCPCQSSSCPATRRILSAVFTDGMQPVESLPGPAYTRIQAVEKWAEAARSIVKLYVEQRGDASTGDGRVVTLTRNGSLKLARER